MRWRPKAASIGGSQQAQLWWPTFFMTLFHTVSSFTSFATTTTTAAARSYTAGALRQQVARSRQHGWRYRLFASSSSSSASFDAESSVAKQKSVSMKQSKNSTISPSNEHEFLQLQQSTFDEMADWFADTEKVMPANLVPVYQAMTSRLLQIARDAKQKRPDNTEATLAAEKVSLRLLDVACGTGSMFPFYLQAAQDHNLVLDITGVDLSTKMVHHAKQRAANLVAMEQYSQHQVRVVASEITQFTVPDSTDHNTTATPTNTTSNDNMFDLIVANACFGNFWNPEAVLRHFSSLTRLGGIIYVTHPLGAAFVQRLHTSGPETVPHSLPTRDEWEKLLCTNNLGLQLLEFQDTVQINDKKRKVYLASLLRVRHSLLTQMIRLRGKVDTGYGRGGKKLGFPTANLPSRFFQNALQTVQPGVYFGYAVIEDNNSENNKVKKGRNSVHKVVVNVGYSPTFEGHENPEKIVEAHFILPPDTLEPADFYGETMRLQLHAFLRPEQKFASFAALIAQIQSDVRDSQAALDMSPCDKLRFDDFLQKHDSNNVWVGQSGGNESASWEFEALDKVLASLSHK